MTRRYEPWVEKHKPPHGFGSHCPAVPEGFSQRLLEQAVADPKKGGNRLYAVHGDWCFAAMSSNDGRYHGYPILGKDMPPAVLKLLQERGVLTRHQREKLRTQSELPSSDPVAA